ncbi:MAG TPA: SDR family oxidoreductase [Steroidobacteraceae bacterium]|nr:SDR family oxidoreductase [Steroidobacteraceae bacterium]
MTPVSIVGCGYTGLRLAQLLVARRCAVRGFATRAASLAGIGTAGAAAVALDLDRACAPIDAAAQLVYYMAPPAPDGSGDPRLERCLDALLGTPQSIVYLSTTGVYGDLAGARVDEDSPPRPGTARAIRRLAAEGALRAWAEARAVPWCILRVAGIYGPGRLPLERLRRGEPAIAPDEARPTNRIHVADLVDACLAAGTSARAANRVFNVADGNDDSQTAFLLRVARIARLPPPPFVSRETARRTFSPSVWSFLGESRRVDNRRLVEELGVRLRYADLDAGIRASLTGD